MKLSKYTLQLVAVVLMFTAFAGYSYMSAAGTWTAPTGTPPANNVDAPINVGDTYQAKTGDLGAVRMRAGYYCDALGSKCSLSIGGSNYDAKIESVTPTLKYENTVPGETSFWTRADNDLFYLLADRNGDDTWTGESPWPLQISAGNVASQDFATFANQVRATQYCNRTGGDCFTPSQVPTIPDCAVGKILISQGNGIWACGDPGVALPAPTYLYNNKHTTDQCTNLGGTVEGSGTNKFCHFNSNSAMACPFGGWTKFQDWDSWSAGSQFCADNGNSCNTAAQAWANTATRPSCSLQCKGVSITGYARMDDIGCY